MNEFALCDADGHEAVTPDSSVEPGDYFPEDEARWSVEILAPKEPAEENENPVEVCQGCAGKLAESYIGYGWDVAVRSLER